MSNHSKKKFIVQKIEEPSWLKEIPNSHLVIKDLTTMFNIHRSTLVELIKRGEFPKPDYISNVGLNFRNRRVRNWNISTIRKYIRELNAT